jgi:hypothetical protein
MVFSNVPAVRPDSRIATLGYAGQFGDSIVGVDRITVAVHTINVFTGECRRQPVPAGPEVD